MRVIVKSWACPKRPPLSTSLPLFPPPDDLHRNLETFGAAIATQHYSVAALKEFIAARRPGTPLVWTCLCAADARFAEWAAVYQAMCAAPDDRRLLDAAVDARASFEMAMRLLVRALRAAAVLLVSPPLGDLDHASHPDPLDRPRNLAAAP